MLEMCHHVVTIAIVNVIANAIVTFFFFIIISGCFLYIYIYLSSTYIILSASILSEPRWTSEIITEKLKPDSLCLELELRDLPVAD